MRDLYLSGRSFYVAVLLIFIVSAATTSLCAANPQALEYLRRARVHYKSQKLSMARDFLNRAIQLAPDDKEIKEFEITLNREIDERIKELNQRAQFFLEARNVPEAEKLFNEVIKLDSGNEFAVEKIGEIKKIYEKVEEFQNSGIEIDVGTGRVHDLDLYSAISYLNRARGLFAQGDRIKALELVNEVLNREPNYKPAMELKQQIEQINELENFLEKTQTAFLEGRMRETVEALNKLIDQMPDRFEFYLMRAKAHLALKNYTSAEEDLWKYYSYDRSAEKVYPMLADVYYGQEKFLHALGFSINNETGVEYRDFSFRFRCRFKQYPLQYFLLLTALLAIPFAAWSTWKIFDDFQKRFPMGTAKLAVKCATTIAFKNPEACLGDLVVLARDVNTPWLNYLTGICLMKIGQLEGAQRFLMYSLNSEGLRVRAGYFTGLTRKLMKQRLQEADFEEAVLSGLGKNLKSWHPRFIKLIEHEIIMKYSQEKTTETFEGMAYKLVNDQVEV